VKRLLITGGKGMLGRTLAKWFASSYEVKALGVSELDITDESEVMRVVGDLKPHLVLHTAAKTNVDGCESEEQAAFRVNGEGSRLIARVAQQVGARLVAFSTDYVFAGDGEMPYTESAVTKPSTVYGRSKAAGEAAIRSECENYVIARIAWLYGPGGPSFLHTMRRLGEQGGDALKIVNDQHGNPTSTLAVAAAVEELLQTDFRGTLHMTCEERATWYDFAQAIFEVYELSRLSVPCSTDEYPSPASRPRNSQLANESLERMNIKMPTWRNALVHFRGEEASYL